MKSLYIKTMALLAILSLPALSVETVDCHDILALFEQPESSGFVFRCHVDNEEVDVRTYPTRDELIEKIKTEYANNTNLHIVSEERLIKDSLPSFEEQLGRPPPKREHYELFISESNCFARYFESAFGDAPSPSPALEVVTVQQGRSQYLSTRIDHRSKTITRSLEETNGYDESHSVLFPADTLRLTWRLYGIHPQVQEQLKGKSIPSILCEDGKIQIANEQTGYQQIGTNKFVLQILTEHQGLGTEMWQYDLEWNDRPQIHRLRTSLGQSIVESQYYYSTSTLFQTEAIPSQVVITATNQEKQSRVVMSDIRQISPEKWDIQSVLNALMNKYSDYSRVEISDATGRDSSRTASSTTENKVEIEPLVSPEMQADYTPSTSTEQEYRQRSPRKIACPRCHGDETSMPTCTLCGGRGSIWVQ
jgi:hypothetical protein